MKEKLFQLVLLDGSVDGCIECFAQNWNVIAYRIPRNRVNERMDDPALNRAGVYFLFGAPDDNSIKPKAYVGQAGKRATGDAQIRRIKEHVKGVSDESYWTEAVAITTVDDTWGATEISFLEHAFYEMAINAGRYVVQNENLPPFGNPRKEKEIDLKEAADMAKYFLGLLGHRVLEPLLEDNRGVEPTQSSETQVELHGEMNDGRGIGVQTSDGFVLKRGSVIATTEADGLSDSARSKRKEIERLLDEKRVLKEDILYRRPSPAAQVVSGSTVSGREFWKDKNGKTMNELDL